MLTKMRAKRCSKIGLHYLFIFIFIFFRTGWICWTYWDESIESYVFEKSVHCSIQGRNVFWQKILIGLFIRLINVFHAAGECTDDRSNMSQNLKKCQNVEISWAYLKSPWEMHSNKYTHAWYWFINSWNSCSNFRFVRKQTQFCSVKLMPAF